MSTRFGVLGDVEARSGDRLVDLGHARQRCVLVILLLEANKVVPVDRITDRVWGGSPPARARDTLYGYLCRLRQALHGTQVTIERRSGGYVLGVAPADVDVHQFINLLGQANATQVERHSLMLFRKALTLWRGEPFVGLDTPWLNSVREKLRRRQVETQVKHGRLALRQGLHNEVLADLADLAEEHPLNEQLVSQYLVALYRSGRPAEALRYYQQIRFRLADELGADPSRPLQRLHQQILAADPALGFSAARIQSPMISPAAHQLVTASPALDCV
ncbi:AfsR/SARP family transcriptional regulator [Actinophytocola sediminis]